MRFLFLLTLVLVSFNSCKKDKINTIVSDDPALSDPQEIFYYRNANFPFPQHSTYHSSIILPNRNQDLMDQLVINFYKQWKSRYIKSFSSTQKYVHYTLEYSVGNAVSCSEGHGFGMLTTVLMAGADTLAYDTYLKLYNFYKAHPSQINSELMAWQQDDAGNDSNGADSATDGDLDIAFSLLLAHMQWGSDGDVDFLSQAVKMINAILQDDINHDYKTIKLGDWVSSGSNYYEGTRCCDFMIDHLKSFDDFFGTNNFEETIDTVYNVIDSVSDSNTGLLPDFVIVENGEYIPCPPNYLEGPNDGFYYYNSCRAPWRIAMDYIITGDDRALDELKRLNSWIYNTTGGDPELIKGGYKLDGTPLATWSDMAFTAPFGVSAMIDDSYQLWLNNLWDEIIGSSISNDSYFGNSIKMICLIVMSGNWWIPKNV